MSPWAVAATRSWTSSGATVFSCSRFEVRVTSHGAASMRPFFCALRQAALLALVAVATGAAQAQNVEAGRTKAAVCAACHGPNGNSPNPQFPVLAGQTARYTYLQLRDFKEGRREAAVMQPMVQNLSREYMLDLAAFFSAQRALDKRFK